MNAAESAARVLHRAYEHYSARELRRDVLATARKLVDYDDATFASYTSEFFSAPPPYMQQYLMNPQLRTNLRRAFAVSRQQGGAYVDTEVYSARERGQLPFFVDFLYRVGFRAQIVAVVHFGGVVSGVIHLNRAGRPFSTDDLERLRPLFAVAGVTHHALETSVAPSYVPSSLPTALTAREREVAFAIADGRSNRDIAGELGTSIHTVKRQVEAVLSKFGVSSRTAVAALLARSALHGKEALTLPPGVPTHMLARVWRDMECSIPG